MDLKSKLMQCFDHWTGDGYTVTVKPWTPITNRRGQTTQQATVIVEGLVPSGQGTTPGPYLDARVTVSYDTEDRRIEVDMTVDNKCDALTLGCNGESVAGHILTTMSRHISSRDVRHERCFDLALQLVESINSNYGPNAY
tara:strand:+ start:5235 stop:5654 length:420 start_codon:yes stop_codon:yes gene_type:complete